MSMIMSFSQQADEVTDSSNNEQLVVFSRWVEINSKAHEDFKGIQAVEDIKSNTRVTVLKDILTRLNIPLSNCCGQCYSRASNMARIKRGAATQIQSESLLAFLAHCYGHALILAVNDMIKKDTLLINTMDTTGEFSKPIKKSPKRKRTLQNI